MSRVCRARASSSATPTSSRRAVAAPASRSSTLDIYQLLVAELGPSRVVRDEEHLARFLVDESGMGRYPAEAAVLCETHAEVALVLRLASEHRIPVTPRGAGTGMTGGALAAQGGIILSTERMTKVREIDEDDMLAVVEPGVITGDLQTAVEAVGLFFPPDPASLASCSLGGNVAENAGGPRAFRYGVTRDYVLGLEAVMMGGETIRPGRRTTKGVTGYDVVGALVGSEGTFAVSTEITLRLLPKPSAVGTLVAIFADVLVAGEAVATLMRARPRALELLDRSTIDHLRGHTAYRLPEGAGALLLLEIDGQDHIDAELEQLGAACEQAGAIEVIVAQNENERRLLWDMRRRANPTLRDAHRRKIPEDIVVPPRKIPAMLRQVDAIAARHDILCATYGHAGDGNLHINLLVDDDRETEGAVAEIMRATLDLGGTLAGEHGVGLLKQRYIPWEQAPPLIRLQRQLKRAFDPQDLLNPGKIFPAP